jgi:hypothetical protein
MLLCLLVAAEDTNLFDACHEERTQDCIAECVGTGNQPRLIYES